MITANYLQSSTPPDHKIVILSSCGLFQCVFSFDTNLANPLGTPTSPVSIYRADSISSTKFLGNSKSTDFIAYSF